MSANADRLMELIEGPIDTRAKELAETLFDHVHSVVGDQGWASIPGVHAPYTWEEVLRPALAQRTYRYLSLRLADDAAGWEAVIGKALEERR